MTPIFLNARYESRPVTGVERYAHEMARRLGDELIPIRPRRPLTGMRAHFWEQCILPGLIPPRRLLWSPANTGPLMVRNQVVTIHDLAPLEHPQWFTPAFARGYGWLWPRLAQRVCHIVTDSEFSRRRIMSLLDVPASKVSVVLVGVDAEQFRPRPAAEVEAVRARYALPEEYALFVGSVQPRKNLGGLLAAWGQANLPGAVLVVAGEAGAAFAVSEVQKPANEFATTRFLGRVPDADLPALYSGARLFVMPSLYEGGGLTVLEALACGCPVIAAGNTALPEYAGDLGSILIDPGDTGALAGAIKNVWGDEDLREAVRLRGPEHARSFSWEKSAEAMREILIAKGTKEAQSTERF